MNARTLSVHNDSSRLLQSRIVSSLTRASLDPRLHLLLRSIILRARNALLSLLPFFGDLKARVGVGVVIIVPDVQWYFHLSTCQYKMCTNRRLSNS